LQLGLTPSGDFNVVPRWLAAMGEATLAQDDTLPAFSGAALPPGAEPPAFDGFQLLRLVGEGGMGEVWLAEQTEPLRRTVALKIIKAGMDTKEVVARFESERQALAMMDHPAIARVFHAGRTPEGRPYFVMEHVDGEAIHAYCDRRRLGTAARVALLAEVCDGVQHAHQKAVIHRDLKPSNILVTEVDGHSQPKIIDFGIAKAIGQRLSERTLLTELGSVIGTPEYMSPEQADSTGADVDTRTDVYSLGVVLYQLLTGRLPFSSERLRRSTGEELRRILREEEPPRPSTLLTTADGTDSAAEDRATDPGTLAGEIAGDLDAITLKALEKDRSRRYGNASDLAADLRRHLRHEPVVARVPSPGYRLRKYLRRHRVGAAVVAGGSILLLAFAVSMALQARRIAAERDRTSKEAAASRRMTEFLTRMFRVTDPSEARGNSVTAREILDRAAADVQQALAGEPELQARMMGTMGSAYYQLGLLPRAEELERQALEIDRRVFGSDRIETVEAVAALGVTVHDRGMYKEAEGMLREAVAGKIRLLGPADPSTLRSMNNLGLVLKDEGRREEAEPIFREVAERARPLLSRENLTEIRALTNLASVYQETGRNAEAESLQRDTLARSRALLGNDHPNTLLLMGNLSNTLKRAGRIDEALSLQQETLVLKKKVLGPEHLHTLNSMMLVWQLLKLQGRLDVAESLARETLALQQRVLGAEHPLTIRGRTSLSGLLNDRGRNREAEQMERETLALCERSLGPKHFLTTTSQLHLAGYLQERAPKEALHLLETAVRNGLEPNLRGEVSTDAFPALRGNPRFEALVAEAQHGAPADP
jgi:non-specific serine/threonine protein kinase/serine/threonine-protein kinase